ncbi:glycosyltransferase family protein [Cellulomonas bogoriensis]|nr:glycosyltransferase [Cellulomonas bogoriensis]
MTDARRALWHLRKGGVGQLRTWARRQGVTQQPSVAGYRDGDGHLTFAPWPIPDRDPTRPDLRVAVILDDFSRLAFRFEWDQVEIQPSTWRQTLETNPVDLLFVESAWAGNGGGWRYHLTGPSAPRPAFVELVEWCRAQGIPTVLWNKEDPAHFDDFLDVARLVDHVFTTDANRVPAYVEALGHDRVGVLPFAAQPAIHNPIRSGQGHQLRDVAFGGMYFAHRHPERREQMDLLLGAAVAVSPRMEHGLEIFSRQLGGDERYQFPAPFDAHVVGSLDYQQMLAAYRAYKVFLNVNTVTDSPSMCARRIFEITASGTPVVSTPSEAISNVFDSFQVPQVGDQQEAEHMLRALVNSPELRDRMMHLAQRTIWAAHTYGHRVDQVLDSVGVDAPRAGTRPTVSALVSTNRPHQLDHVLRTVGSQSGLDVELCILTHGWRVPDRKLRAKAAEMGVKSVVHLDAEADVTLGECLNRLVDAASGDVVAKMDDDDIYGDLYLSDQLDALAYSGSDIVGKQAHYVYAESLNATVLRFGEREKRVTDFVVGPTLLTSRLVAREVPFPCVGRGEDTGFLRQASDRGASIFSSDRYNYLQVRRRAQDHTWKIPAHEVLAGATVTGFGIALDHVLLNGSGQRQPLQGSGA